MELSFKANAKWLQEIDYPSRRKLTDIKKKSTLNSFLFFQKVIKQAGPAASASYTLVASVLIFILIGHNIDSSFNSFPIGLIIGLIIGLAIGFYQLFKLVIWKQKNLRP